MKHYASTFRLLPTPFSQSRLLITWSLPWIQITQMSFFLHISPVRSSVRYPFPSFFLPLESPAHLFYSDWNEPSFPGTSFSLMKPARPVTEAMWYGEPTKLSVILVFVKSFKTLFEPNKTGPARSPRWSLASVWLCCPGRAPRQWIGTSRT